MSTQSHNLGFPSFGLMLVACSEIIGAMGYLQKRTGRDGWETPKEGLVLHRTGRCSLFTTQTGYGVPTFRRRQAASCAATHVGDLA